MNNNTLSNIIAIIMMIALTILGIKIVFALSSLVFKIIGILVMVGIVILILKYLASKNNE